MRPAMSLLLLAACGTDPLPPGESASYDAADTLEVTTTSGRIEVVAHDADTIDVEVLPGNGSDTWEADESGSTLEVRAMCSDGTEGCSVGFIVYVPADTDIELRADNGEVAAKGALTGEVHLQTTSGDVVGIDLGPVDLDVLTNGTADVSFADRPARVWLDGGAGDLSLTIPAGSYDLQLEGAGSENIDIDIVDDDSSEVIYLEAAGDKTVQAGG